jgi:voltage-gated potassium channel
VRRIPSFSYIRRLLTRDWLRRDVAWRLDRGMAAEGPRLLYAGVAASPQRKLLFRVALVAGLLGVTMLVFWLDRAGLYDTLDGEISFTDIVYFTFVTVTTVGYGDIVPISDRARLIDALLVTPIRFFVLFVFLGTAYEFIIKRVIEDYRMNAIQQKLVSHVIVCGFGFSGRVAARELVVKGQPKEGIVVIDTRADRLEAAAEAGYIGLRGDASREVTLREARLETARAALICLSPDNTAALTVLTVRSLNERIRIIALVQDEENQQLLRRAGADEVVIPAKMAGFLAADAVESRYTTRFVSDVLSSSGGMLKIIERRALAEEVGTPFREVAGRLVVAVEREGAIVGFWDHPDEVIREGDLIFAIEGS